MKPARAAVRPRFVSASTGETLALEDSVTEAFRRFHCGIVEIAGPHGSGKTHAVQHLAAVLPPELKVVFVGRLTPEQQPPADVGAIVEVDSDAAPLPNRIARFQLAPWDVDEYIEYSMFRHPQQCRSVIARILAAPDRATLNGQPDLCVLVLDRMSKDESLTSIAEALRAELWEHVGDNFTLLPELQLLSGCTTVTHDRKKRPLKAEIQRLLRNGLVRIAAEAMEIARDLNRGRFESLFQSSWVPADSRLGQHIMRTLVNAMSPLIQKRGLEHIEAAIERRSLVPIESCLASLMVRGDSSWRPLPAIRPILRLALLEGADWHGVDLCRYELQGAELSRANLDHALLIAAQAETTNFTGASLRDARLRNIRANAAVFRGCDLRGMIATNGDFTLADLSGANAERSSFHHADLSDADLSRACFRSAILRRSILKGAILCETDLTRANLSRARLQRVDLRSAVLHHTDFTKSDLSGANLEGVGLQNGWFRDARLSSANLTAASLTYADFQGADLSEAYLAEADLSGSDLSNAILSGATFHMGSSRSGLVGSDLASEGTRTGFYCNDYDDHHFQQPEDIRTANLSGCDLRGARIRGVDFWRVDLRGAQYDSEQRAQFVATGALLE